MKIKNAKHVLLGLTGFGLIVTGGLAYRHYRANMNQAYRRISSGGKVIETACGPIEYTEYGEGAPVLVVHGTGGGYDQGEFIARELGGNFRWIAPSRFGYLKTPLPEDASSALQAEAHACLLDALGIDRVAVVAYSAGGPSSLLFALRYPERTRSLAMISAFSHPVPYRPSLIEKVYWGFSSDFFYWSFVHASKQTLLASLGTTVADQKSLPPDQMAAAYAVLENMVPMGARKNGLFFDLTRLGDYDADQIQNIQAPTLVVHASNDTLVQIHHGRFTAEKVPGAQLIELDKGGHFGILFNAEARAKVVAFLEQSFMAGK